MKKFFCLILILIFTIPLIFAGGGRDRSSNRIVIYTSMYEDSIEAVRQSLRRQFPRYDIRFVYGGTGILQARIASEKSRGRLGCDILMVADPAYALELKQNEMLHSFTSREAGALAFDYDREGYWYPVRVSIMILAYNPVRFTFDNVPHSFRYFSNDARARNAISMRNPLASGTTMAAITALKDRYGYEYFDALGRQRVIIDYGADESLRRLEAGETRAAMILEESILRIRHVNNSQLQAIYPTDGVVIIPSPIMVINNRWSANQNTRAAQEIANWFLTSQGQEAIVDSWMHSVRSDFERVPTGSKPMSEIRENSIPVNWENVLEQRNEIIQRFEEMLAASR